MWDSLKITLLVLLLRIVDQHPNLVSYNSSPVYSDEIMEQLAAQHRANRFANASNFRSPDEYKFEHFDAVVVVVVVAGVVEIVQ